jgi:ribosomal protein S18 acetylase RimI-like enzyme
MVCASTVTISRNWAKLHQGRRLIGKLKIWDLSEPGAYISHFNVKEAYRSSGNGSCLLQAALEFAKNIGCTAVSLHCSKSNARAIAFYQRHGFFICTTTTKPRLSMETGIVEYNYLMARQI